MGEQAQRIAGEAGSWALAAWQSGWGRQYELRLADDLSPQDLARAIAQVPAGSVFEAAGVADGGPGMHGPVLGTGRPELRLVFSRGPIP